MSQLTVGSNPIALKGDVHAEAVFGFGFTDSGQMGIPSADYSAEQLDQELELLAS